LKAEAFINKGDFEDPYSPDDLLEKYFELATPVWGKDISQQLHGAVSGLDEISDVRQVTRLLAP
jgi:hypothetical protein